VSFYLLCAVFICCVRFYLLCAFFICCVRFYLLCAFLSAVCVFIWAKQLLEA